MSDYIFRQAKQFAKLNIRVLPVVANSKTPAIKDWPTAASTFLPTINNWFTKEFPDCNYAVLCDRLIVIDVDSPEHSGGSTKDGIATLAQLEAQYEPLPDTFTVETPSGGRHYYFQRPPTGEYRKGANKLGPGIDIQTGKACIQGPGSTINGKQYRIINKHGITKLPTWIAELLKAPPAPAYTPTEPSANVSDTYWKSAIEGELNRLEDLSRNGWNGEPWDHTTYKVACNLIEIANNPNSGYTNEQARADFMRHAPTDERFTTLKHEEKWRSATTTVGGKQRQPLPSSQPAPQPPKQNLPKTLKSPALTQKAELISNPEIPETTPDTDTEEEQKPQKPPPCRYVLGAKLLPEDLAAVIKHGFALGPDNTLWYYQDGIYSPENGKLNQLMVKLLRNHYKSSHLSNMESYLKGLPEDQVPRLTNKAPDSRYIILNDGVLDWKTGELHPHNPEFKATVKLPITYHTDEPPTCPEFDRFLTEVVPGDAIEYVWEAIGYLLRYGNPKHTAFLLQGPGGSGKSTFLRVVQHLLGDENVVGADLKELTEDRYAPADLLNKTADICADIAATHLRDSSIFKRITGQEKLRAQHKYGQAFHFHCWAVPVFAANDFWSSSDSSSGYLRRWQIISFPNKVMGTRRLNEQALLDEATGIFHKAIDALRQLDARNNEFTIPDSIAEISAKFEQTTDSIIDWLDSDERVTINDKNNNEVYTRRVELYDAYSLWAKQSNLRPLSATKFHNHLGNLGYSVHNRRQNKRVTFGIQLTPKWDTSIY